MHAEHPWMRGCHELHETAEWLDVQVTLVQARSDADSACSRPALLAQYQDCSAAGCHVFTWATVTARTCDCAHAWQAGGSGDATDLQATGPSAAEEACMRSASAPSAALVQPSLTAKLLALVPPAAGESSEGGDRAGVTGAADVAAARRVASLLQECLADAGWCAAAASSPNPHSAAWFMGALLTRPFRH